MRVGGSYGLTLYNVSAIRLFVSVGACLLLHACMSMFLSIISAVFISTGFPFFFKKINSDPAIASGLFATMISDVATMTIYFSIASVLLAFFKLM